MTRVLTTRGRMLIGQRLPKSHKGPSTWSTAASPRRAWVLQSARCEKGTVLLADAIASISLVTRGDDMEAVSSRGPCARRLAASPVIGG